MADTETTHYALTKPEPGGSADTWGGKLNTNFDAIDAALDAVSEVADGALQADQNLADLINKGTARANLDLEPGIDVQAYHANIAQLAGLSLATDKLPYANGVGTLSLTSFTATARNLLDDGSVGAMQGTLQLTPGTYVQPYAATLTSLASASADGVSLVQAPSFSAMASLLGVATGTGSQGYSDKLTAIHTVTWSADKLIYLTGTTSCSTSTLTSLARDLLDDTSQAAMQSTLGLRPGTEIQAQNALLSSIASTGVAAGKILIGNGANSVMQADCTSAGLELLNDADASAQRATLGLGSAALASTGTSGATIPRNDTANTFSQAQSLPTGSTYSGLRIAHVASGSSSASGKISWGTGEPPALAEGEIYLRYEA